ncbi:hypothetical protein JW930_03795 [Candidatus Woesearchaeota archaeon]|nr:hypothetical protein [Candidatus Woesearchaeota archaeon]
MEQEKLLERGDHRLHAKATLDALYELFLSSEGNLSGVLATREAILNSTHKNMLLKNSIKYFFHDLKKGNLKQQAKTKHLDILKYYHEAHKKISDHLEKKLRKNSSLFLASYSDIVADAIKEIAQKNKFTLLLLETNPLNKLKNQFPEKAKNNITFITLPDLAISAALARSDYVLISSSLITSEGSVLSTVGAGVVARTAKEHHVPVYVCANSWSHNPGQGANSLYINELKEEIVPPNHIQGIICEFGIFKPELFVKENYYHNPWLFG